MGYDVHITRRQQWSDNDTGPEIAKREWEAAIAGDSDADAFYWFEGDISVKYPNEAMIGKMVRLAHQLGAKVQGDDGELYREDGSSDRDDRSPVPSRSQIAQAKPAGFLRRWIRSFTQKKRTVTSPYRIGQRVKDSWGAGTITFVDPRAEGGLGIVRVRFDDGREASRACIASGLEIVD